MTRWRMDIVGCCWCFWSTVIRWRMDVIGWWCFWFSTMIRWCSIDIIGWRCFWFSTMIRWCSIDIIGWWCFWFSTMIRWRLEISRIMFSFPIFLRHDDIKTTREQANKIKGVCIVAGLVWFRKGERPTSNLNLTDMTDMTACKRLSRVYGEGKTAPGAWASPLFWQPNELAPSCHNFLNSPLCNGED